MKFTTASLLLPLVLATTIPALADGAGADPLVGTNWQLTNVGGTPAVEGVKSTLIVAGDGTVNGNGGCNGYGGSVKIDGDTVSFSQMRSTMMACAEKAMSQEHALHGALEATRSYRIEGQTLSLLDSSGAPVATFEAAQ